MAVSTIISIEITDACTKVCEMENAKRNPQVFRSLIFENPQYSIDDGFIADRRSYGRELKAQLKKAHMSTRNVVFSLASNKIVSREITIPEMKPEQISELIENERANYFPMDTSQHQFTFTILQTMKETKQMRVLVFAAPIILIQNYRALAIENGLKLIRIDYNGNSIVQWLKRPACRNMNLYLQINERNTLFTIMENGMFYLQRNMNFGYESFLASGGGVDAVRPLVANIASVLEYYSAKNKEADISTIYVGGIGAHIEALKSVIEREFNGIELSPLDILPDFKTKKKDTFGQSHSTELIACLGASSPSINFYKVSRNKTLGKAIGRAVGAYAIVAAALLMIIVNGRDEYTAAENKKLEMQLKYADLLGVGIDSIETDVVSKVVILSEMEEMNAKTMTYTGTWNAIMKALEESLVSNTIITSLSMSESGVMMNVNVGSKLEAAKLMTQLRGVEYFSDVAMNAISDSTSNDEGGGVAFSVVCAFEGKAVFEDVDFDKQIVEDLGLGNLNGFNILQGLGGLR